MSTLKNFPINTGDDGTRIAATAANQTVQIAAQPGRKFLAEDVLIDNPGPNDVFVRAGGADVVATTDSVRVPAGTMQVFEKGQTSHLAVVCKASQAQQIVVHVGSGA